MRTPLIFIILSYIFGILFSEIADLEIKTILIILVVLIVLTILTVRIRYFTLFILLSIFSCGLLAGEASKEPSINNISNYLGNNPQKAIISGKVITDPEYIFKKDLNIDNKLVIEKASFLVQIDSAKVEQNETKTSGVLYVNAWKKDISLKFGDKVLLEGKIYPLGYKENNNDSGFDFKKYFTRKGISAFFKMGQKDALIIIGNESDSIRKIIFNLRHNVEKKIFDYFPKDYAELLRAMVLGIRYGFDDSLEEKFVNTGTVHILAISGMNVGMILFVIMVILQIIRVPRKLKYIIAAFAIGFFMIFSGAKPPVVRATLMAELFLLGLIFNRSNSLENAFYVSAFLMLIYDPLSIFDPSFQLSFASLAGLIYITPKLNSIFLKDDMNSSLFVKIKSYLIMTLNITLGAMGGVLGFVVYYFNIVSPIGIISNILIVPLVFVITVFGIGAILLSYLIPYFAILFSYVTDFFIWLMFFITDILSSISYGHFKTGKISGLIILIYYCVIILYLNSKRLSLVIMKR